MAEVRLPRHHVGVPRTAAPLHDLVVHHALVGEHHDARAWISALLAVGGIALMTLL